MENADDTQADTPAHSIHLVYTIDSNLFYTYK